MKHEQIAPTASFTRQQLERKVQRQLIRGDFANLFGEAVPEELLTPYSFAAADADRVAMLQQKYTNRAWNIRRCWNRTERFLPELMIPGAPPQQVLELSTAHGGMLEVARHFGHGVMGTDYANFVYTRTPGKRLRMAGEDTVATRPLNDPTFDRTIDDHGIDVSAVGDDGPDWPYRPITDAVGIPMTVFDAGKTPYPFEDKSYDVLMCMQAIEHYCHPDHWHDVVDEMCRISRRTVVILLNPVNRQLKQIDGYVDSYTEFRRSMRCYNRNGFVNVASFMHWGKAVGFKLMAL